MQKSERLLELLGSLERQMQLADCWQAHPIDPEALESQQPFAVDTMSFSQWLQFVLVPRLRAVIEAGADLPQGSQIAVMGQMVWQGEAQMAETIVVLGKIDGLLGRTEP